MSIFYFFALLFKHTAWNISAPEMHLHHSHKAPARPPATPAGPPSKAQRFRYTTKQHPMATKICPTRRTNLHYLLRATPLLLYLRPASQFFTLSGLGTWWDAAQGRCGRRPSRQYTLSCRPFTITTLTRSPHHTLYSITHCNTMMVKKQLIGG